ncbi:hypothetical protein [Riemerella anatipestifer]|uniref:hypothetical protein n=1 Tax=Riemerella anatipestifer TaxID=34085 RepID=UPI002363E231|nr:hypothetical protein [Riemerella anatipestifer]MDD1538308.1 hypothetical protein [Riemerella anatipestifer]
MKKILLSTIALYLVSCNGGVSKEDYLKVKKELENCKATVADLQNTSQQRLAKAQTLYSENKYNEAQEELSKLIKMYPLSAEAEKGKAMLSEINSAIEKEKIEAEKRKTLGFKALTENSIVNVGDLKLSFNSVNIGNRWIMDAYGNEWHYRDAERGNKMVMAKVSITSKDKNPSLPPICVYRIVNGELYRVGVMSYKFSKWEDYATYLGNYHDRGNDFAYRPTISFSCGFEMKEEDINSGALFIIVKNNGCFSRSTDRFDSPPVRYEGYGCNPKSKLTLEDFEKDYTLVKIFNKQKL